MWWVHSIMPSKSGRTNGWVFDLCRLSPETFGHSVYWQLLHTQFCCFTVFTGATFHLLSSKGLFVTLTRPGWGSGLRKFMPAYNVLVLTTGRCDVARSWRYWPLNGLPQLRLKDETGCFCTFVPSCHHWQEKSDVAEAVLGLLHCTFSPWLV